MLISGSEKRLWIASPAKLNLYLEVLGKRPDGYHELDTIMMAVSLCDHLLFLPRADSEIRLHLYPAPDFDGMMQMTTDDSNLVVQALKRMQAELPHANGMDVHLWKRIPLQAGLGGGSSNAAAALIAGGLVWSKRWNPEQASRLASQMGSDVNFFLDGNLGKMWTGRCRGRGERVEPISNSLDFWVVIVKPAASCSTAEVFRQLDFRGNPVPIDETLVAIEQSHLSQLGECMFNRLAGPAQQVAPTLRDLYNHFEAEDVLGHLMTGSGSARFAICRSSAHAKAVARRACVKCSDRVFVARNWRTPSIAAQVRAMGFAG